MSKSQFIKLLCVFTAIAIAIAPDLTQINPMVARYVVLAGLAAAAARRALRTRRHRRTRSRKG
jgi:putative effector of murein hydrolase